MRVVVVEDQPLKMSTSIKTLQEMGIEVVQLIYACFDDDTYQETYKWVEDMCGELGISFKRAEHYNFDVVMDTFYEKPDIIFFCDFNLYLGQEKYPEERVNVLYAKKKMEQEEGKLNRIWFYTTAGASANEQINTYFPGHNITVTSVKNNQVLLSFDKVKQIMQSVES